MEIQVPQQLYCPGDTVFMPLITRVLSNDTRASCDLSNTYAIVGTNWVYNFQFSVTDNGDPANNSNYTASLSVDQNYVNNNTSFGNAVDLNNGLSIFFNDVDHDCPTCISGSGTLYNPTHPNYQFGIGECDSDAPPRPDCPSSIWYQPNWTHELVYVIPNYIVGPATIDFTGSYENGSYYEAVTPPPPLPPIPTISGPFAFPQTLASGTVTGGTECNTTFTSEPLTINVRNSSDSECGGGGPLALSIINFTGSIIGDEASVLSFVVSSDENIEINLEHSVNPEERFKEVEKWVYLNSSFEEVIESSYTHTTPSPGFNYYRLKIIRENGSIEYSDVVSLEFDRDLRSESIKVYPNPVRDVITIENGKSFNEIEVYNIQGRLLKRADCEQTNRYQVGTSELEPGKYFIRITGKDLIETISFIKL